MSVTAREKLAVRSKPFQSALGAGLTLAVLGVLSLAIGGCASLDPESHPIHLYTYTQYNKLPVNPPAVRAVELDGSAVVWLETQHLLDTLDVSSHLISPGQWEVIAQGGHVRTLNASSTGLTDEGLVQIARFSELAVLDISGNHDITTFAALRRCAKLSTLIVGGSTATSELNITPEMVEAIASLPVLAHLNFRNCIFTDRALSNLALAKQLESLELIDCYGFTDAGVGHLRPLQSVERLVITGNNNTITDKAIEALAPLPIVRSLVLGSMKITDASIRTLAGCPNLEELDLSTTAATGHAAHLLSNTKLKKLYVGRAWTTDGLKNIQNLNLRTLRISNCKLDAEAVQGLERLATLEELLLDSCTFSTPLTPLLSLMELSHLALSNSGLTDEDLPDVSRLRALRWLDLSANFGMTDAVLSVVARCSQLEYLALNKTSIAWDHEPKVGTLSHLRALHLAGTPIQHAGIVNIAALATIEKLVLPTTLEITDSDIKALCNLQNLRELVLGDCERVTNEGLSCLRGLARLEVLVLGGDAVVVTLPNVTNAGLQTLASIKTLRHARLGKCPKVTEQTLRDVLTSRSDCHFQVQR